MLFNVIWDQVIETFFADLFPLRSTSLIGVRSSRPILPATSDPSQQLVLRWPVAGSQELSNSNFSEEKDKSLTTEKRKAQEETKQSSKKVTILKCNVAIPLIAKSGMKFFNFRIGQKNYLTT